MKQIPVTAVQAALTTSAGGVATLSLPPHPAAAQQQHLEVTGAGTATATVVLTSEDVEKDKLDKGTCTTERCGENQVHCQVSVNYCHVLAASDTVLLMPVEGEHIFLAYLWQSMLLGQGGKLGQIFLQIISLTINSISIQNNVIAHFLFLLVVS